jgi:hypothetical protein
MTTTPGDILDHTPLKFGKHAGKTPDQISEIDPSYIVWMWNEWKASGKPPPCSKLLYVACENERNERDAERDFDAFGLEPDE